MKNVSLGFIGSGRMASAMVRGILKQNLLSPAQISCLGGGGSSALRLSQETGIHLSAHAEDLAQRSTYLVLACKPAQLSQLDAAWSHWSQGKSFLSVLAGISLKTLHTRFAQARSVIRSMPNTPSQVGAGVTAYATDEKTPSEDLQVWQQLLGSLGSIVAVKEPELDLVTALSGSGPAYFFEITHQLTEAAIRMGLASDKARLLARQTFIGAARLLDESEREAEDLRKEVTSPGGTTEAGLKVLSQHDLGQLLQQTLQAAANRSQELSKS